LQPEAALDLLTSLVGAERIQQESNIAEQLCDWLDYLPLGLELVGRYLERDPDLSLKAMLSLLEKKRLRHKSVLEADSMMTARLGVADAFELSWERLDENAQFLGCLLSLFASADIPWDLVKLAYSNLPSSENEEIDLDILEEARVDLVRFNLLQRTGKGTYRLHQLIREFLREKREQSAQVNDLKQAFVAAMVAVARQVPGSPTRQQIQKLAPAVLHVAEVTKDKDLWGLLHDEDLIEPFASSGRFYQGQGFYEQAAYWLEQCLSVTQDRYGSDHLNVASSLNNLALLYHYTGCYSKAESLYLQALDFYNRLLGEKDIALANNLNNLAGLYASQSRYSEAEPLYLKALELLKNLLGEEHPRVANSLNNLAGLYESQGRYAEAEPLYLQALELNQRLLGDDHPDTVLTLGNLGSLYYSQELYSKAEPLLVQVLELNQRLLGEAHPRVIGSLNNLAELYRCQDCHGKAEPLLVQALKLSQSLWGEDHPNVAIHLNNLALVYEFQGVFSKAEPLYWQALELRKRLLGEDHPKVAITLNNLAGLYYLQEFYSEAEFFWVQALEIFERRLGSGHPHTIECQEGLAMVRGVLNSTARDLPNFNQKAKKGGSKKKGKGFGKG
jgi:tetratricopeptide (TPR) repeat protein